MSDSDEVKSRLNIVDVISERVSLKKAGRNFKALCPFHSEKTPSFIVSPERQSFKCFGCGKGGSVIDFVMEYDHVDFPEALEMLAQKAGVKLERRAPDTAEETLKQRIYEVNHLASEFYHYLLTKHRLGEAGRAYLRERGISDTSINTFALGYSPNSWDGLLKFLRKKGYDENLLETAGLVIRGHGIGVGGQTFYDRFRGRVMFTLKDHRGNVVGFAGRVLPSTTSSMRVYREAKYINTSETPVYVKSNVLYGLDVTREAIRRAHEAVVMEGELDVISSFQAGIPNAVAIKGSALTEGHVRLLRRFTDRLAFALDSDVAADAASRRGIEIADRAGMDMRIVILPAGKDPDEAVRQNPAAFREAIEKAIPIYDYFIKSASSRFDAGTAFGKKKIGDELIPVFAKIDNPIIQAHYVKKLARVLDVGEASIVDSMEKVKRTMSNGRSHQEASPLKTTSMRTRQEKLEMYLLALLLQGETVGLAAQLGKTIDRADVTQPAVRQILEHLETFLKKRKRFNGKDFAERLPQELVATFDEAYLWDIADLLDDKKRFAREWEHAIREFHRVTIRRKMEELSKKVRQEGKKENLNGVEAQLKDLTQALRRLEKQDSI